jgi:hypothetical protein
MVAGNIAMSTPMVRGDGSLPGPLCVASKPLGWPGWDGPTSQQEYP